jgi:hypothetical protein
VYLVCSRANMRAGGCKYLAVPYARVEEALRENAHNLISEAPRGKSTAGLEKQIDSLQGNVEAGEDLADELTDLLAHERSETVRRRLAAVESVKSHSTATPFRGQCRPPAGGKSDPSDGAKTGVAEPHIAEQSRSWRAASGEREVMRGS